MELTEELKGKLAGCKTAEEARALLRQAGVELTDEALNDVVGGSNPQDLVDALNKSTSTIGDYVSKNNICRL